MKSMQNLLIAAALGLASCAVVAASTPEKPVRIAAPFEIKGSDPALSGDILLRMDVVETLVEVNDRGEPVAALAQRWQVSDDGLRWQFQLRDGVHFHDGSLLDAVAVVKSLNTARGKAGLLDKTPIADISGAGQLVTITLREPFTPLLSVLAESRSQILALASWDAQGNITRIIGSGPFKLTSFQPHHRRAGDHLLLRLILLLAVNLLPVEDAHLHDGGGVTAILQPQFAGFFLWVDGGIDRPDHQRVGSEAGGRQGQKKPQKQGAQAHHLSSFLCCRHQLRVTVSVSV